MMEQIILPNNNFRGLNMKTFISFSRRGCRSYLWILAFVLALVASGCDSQEPTTESGQKEDTPVSHRITKDEAIESLTKMNISVTTDSLSGFAGQGDLTKVKLLITAGVDVNGKDERGSNALIEASWAGRQDVVSYLLDNGADVNSDSSKKFTALSAAIGRKHEAIALLLLNRGANPNVVDPAGSTPLIEAAWQGEPNLVKALLEKGANVNFKRPDNGFSALKAAGNKTEIVEILKSAGATE